MPETQIVQARESFVPAGVNRTVKRGETFEADHPIVLANRHRFKAWEPDYRTSTGAPRAAVEHATRAPGEKRQTTHPSAITTGNAPGAKKPPASED